MIKIMLMAMAALVFVASKLGLHALKHPRIHLVSAAPPVAMALWFRLASNVMMAMFSMVMVAHRYVQLSLDMSVSL